MEVEVVMNDFSDLNEPSQHLVNVFHLTGGQPQSPLHTQQVVKTRQVSGVTEGFQSDMP